MDPENDQQILAEVKEGLKPIEEDISDHGGWLTLDIPSLSEEELIKVSEEFGLDIDEQTRLFTKFLSITTNFSGMDLKSRIKIIPELVNTIEKLIREMRNEIKEYAKIANEFESIVQCFVRLVLDTKHKINMMLPLLESSSENLEILADVLESSKDEYLNTDDQKDFVLAIDEMMSGVNKLLKYAEENKRESEELGVRINNLREKSTNNLIVSEKRLKFANLTLPIIGISAGAMVGGSIVIGATASTAFGGIGALAIAGLLVPPVGAVLFAVALGAGIAGSVAYLIGRWYGKHQEKAIKYLNNILSALHKLNCSNIYFTEYLNQTRETSNDVLNKIETMKNERRLESKRFRKQNAKLARKAKKSTESMIEVMRNISKMKLGEWIENRAIITMNSNDEN